MEEEIFVIHLTVDYLIGRRDMMQIACNGRENSMDTKREKSSLSDSPTCNILAHKLDR